MNSRPNGKGPPMIGAALLDDIETFLGRFIAFPDDAARVAHTLWCAHCHLMDCWESTPRIAFLSPEPGSGKTRCLEVTELLVPRPVTAINCSSAYLFRKVADKAGLPTILFDEIDALFGPKAANMKRFAPCSMPGIGVALSPGAASSKASASKWRSCPPIAPSPSLALAICRIRSSRDPSSSIC